MKPPLLAVVGPTASGKSDAAIALAKRFGGEIINADPQQFYRGLDIGTAKPSPEDRLRIKHHLLDIIDPDERPALRLFQKQALELLSDLWARGVLPIVVGGSGQYIWGLVEGWTVPAVPPDPALRETLEKRARSDGAEVLHAELRAVDPEAAGKIDVNNVRRVIRALEVYQRTGKLISSCQQRRPLEAEVCVLGMAIEDAELEQRIEKRTNAMFATGLVREAASLMAAGCARDLPSLRSIGYREAVAVALGEMTEEEAIVRTRRETRRLARKQMAWFKRDDPRIHWVRWDDHDSMVQLVAQSLGLTLRLAQRAPSAEA